MLKRDWMAAKTAKFLSPKVGKENKNLIETLEQAYKLGYDLAVEECLKDDSKSGDQMNEYLSTLEAPVDGK